MFVQLFREIRQRDDDCVEMLDRDALRARIGECKERAPERRDEIALPRIDAPRPSAARTWRDIAGLSR